LFEGLKHPVLIESAVAKIGFSVDFDFQLPGPFSNGRVDSRRSQPTQMLVPLMWIDDMYGLIAALKPLLDKREQHSIFLVVIREERTDMASRAKLRTGQRDWWNCPGHFRSL
jgi:hypothetical protein